MVPPIGHEKYDLSVNIFLLVFPLINAVGCGFFQPPLFNRFTMAHMPKLKPIATSATAAAAIKNARLPPEARIAAAINAPTINAYLQVKLPNLSSIVAILRFLLSLKTVFWLKTCNSFLTMPLLHTRYILLGSIAFFIV